MSYSFGQWPFTILVLMYDDNGKYYKLHEKFLTTLYSNTNPAGFKLRLALNSCTNQTRELIDRVARPSGNIEKIYDNGSENTPKYIFQRDIYYDKALPISTDWVIWFDDDTYFDKGDWLEKLAAKIDEVKRKPLKPNYEHGVHAIGKRWFIHLKEGWEDWLKAASWYTGRPIPLHKGKIKKTDFLNGAFICHTMEMFRTLNWPDIRLSHNGGDMMLGSAMWQNGFETVNHIYGVCPNKEKRRGISEKTHCRVGVKPA